MKNVEVENSRDQFVETVGFLHFHRCAAPIIIQFIIFKGFPAIHLLLVQFHVFVGLNNAVAMHRLRIIIIDANTKTKCCVYANRTANCLNAVFLIRTE